MKTISALYPAIFLYILFIALKINRQDWATDLPGLHAGIGAIFLLFGAAVCHLTFIFKLQSTEKNPNSPQKIFWVTATFAFLLMFMDSTFGIHERYSVSWGIPEQTFFVVYGSMFIMLVATHLRKLSISFLALFAAFGVVSVAAILGDMSSDHEGLIFIGGTPYSFEQFLETFGCLLLASAFTLTSVDTLIPHNKIERSVKK